ncbi:hypothetical protein [Bradyrhizobium sp. URHC0002]
MFWDRLLAGALGLFLAFSAGGKLQLWLDEGKVWRRSKNREPRLLSFDETPFSYVSEIVLCFLAVLFGLALVWWALGGSLKKKS